MWGVVSHARSDTSVCGKSPKKKMNEEHQGGDLVEDGFNAESPHRGLGRARGLGVIGCTVAKAQGPPPHTAMNSSARHGLTTFSSQSLWPPSLLHYVYALSCACVLHVFCMCVWTGRRRRQRATGVAPCLTWSPARCPGAEEGRRGVCVCMCACVCVCPSP